MQLQTLFKSQHDKKLLYTMIQLLFKTTNNQKLSEIVDDLIARQEFGEFFSMTQKALFWIFQHSTKNIPDISIPFLKEYLKQECHKFLIDLYDIDNYLERLAFWDKQATITFLEPMALYEEEALKVVEKYIQILAHTSVNRISIDVSTIEPKINFITQSSCLNHLENKFSMLLRQANKYTTSLGKAKFVCFELDNDTFARAFEIINKVILKDEFQFSRIGFSFKLNLFNNIAFLEKIIAFSEILVALGGQKITIRLEDSNVELATDSHFQHCVYWLLKKKNQAFIDVVINSYNAYHLSVLNTIIQKNDIQSMVKIETFMGFQSLCKECNLLYTPIVSFEEFNNAVDYLLEKLNAEILKTVFYDFGAKNVIYLSSLCHQRKSIEHILEKINLVYEKSGQLELEIFVEEELIKENSLIQEFFKSIKSMFSCFDSNAVVTLNDDSYIHISLYEFQGVIAFKSVVNIFEAIKYIKAQKESCAYKIYTLYEEEERLFYDTINS